MNLSVSNIAWGAEQDEPMYAWIRSAGFSGLEIAPTRIFPENPYGRPGDAEAYSQRLKSGYSLSISSMQSIWFGRSEKLFGTREEYLSLREYTKRAIDFASAMHCGNLVFGCPKNRVIPDCGRYGTAVDFFRELGEYAAGRKTVLSIEPNPVIYGTNFINTTPQAFALARDVGSGGFRVNVDTGTILYNRESVSCLSGRLEWVNHIHISEPGLSAPEKRSLHRELAALLREENYSGYVSLEMKKQDDLGVVKDVMQYVREVFS